MFQFEEALPKDDSPLSVLGSIHCVMRELGRELGAMYSEAFNAALGPNWLQILQNMRAKQINPTDPHFVLVEPLQNSDSPVRAALGLNGIKLALIEDARDERNRWSHGEVHEWTLATLAESIKPFHKLATALELGGLGKLCAETKQRIKDINEGRFKPFARSRVPVSLQNLKEQYAELQHQKRLLQDEVEAALALAESAEHAGAAAQQSAADRVQQLQEQLQQALDANAELEFKMETLARAAVAPEDHWVDVEPGHPWPAELPGRELVVMGLQTDLFDAVKGQGVASEFGAGAKSAIQTWKAFLPANAKVRCTGFGQCVAFVGGIWAYLGCLAEDQSSAPAAFFTPFAYALRMNGDIENRETGLLLTDVLGYEGEVIAQHLLVHAPEGGQLRVTPDGQVCVAGGSGWIPVYQLRPERWFPGHL